jgi:septum formation protein
MNLHIRRIRTASSFNFPCFSYSQRFPPYRQNLARPTTSTLAIRQLNQRRLLLPLLAWSMTETAIGCKMTGAVDIDPLDGLRPLILGSASYTRKLILKEMGVDYHVLVRPIDERQVGYRDTDTPEQLVHAVAHAKMSHLVKEIISGNCDDDLPSKNETDEWIVLTADQVVTCQGLILEKPDDVNQAKDFVAQYGKFPCSTVGCIVVTHLPSQTTVSGIHSATIHFLASLTTEKASELVDRLIEADAPILSCAGGLMIEHPLTQLYVDSIEGNVDSVMGLCPETVRRLLRALREAVPPPTMANR